MTPQEVVQHNETKLQNLYHTAADSLRAFLLLAFEAGYLLRITHGFRSVAEQNELYSQGRTKEGNIVTNARGGESLHNFGLAIDVYDVDKGYKIDWDELKRIANSVGVEHGDRGFNDLPHFQYRDDLTLEQVQFGVRPKENQLLNELTMQQYEDLKRMITDLQNQVQKLEDIHTTKKNTNRVKKIQDQNKEILEILKK